MSNLIHLSEQRQYHLYRKETDMRKGFNQLCGIVTNELGRTCKMHGVEPYAWLKDILSRIADHPVNRVAELLPQQYKK